MRIPTASSAVRAWVACVCLVLLLGAAWAQAGHVCGALQGGREGVRGAGVSSGICPICALAQPATPGTATVALAPVMSVTTAILLPEPQHHSFCGLFSLNVRPPPA